MEGSPRVKCEEICKQIVGHFVFILILGVLGTKTSKRTHVVVTPDLRYMQKLTRLITLLESCHLALVALLKIPVSIHASHITSIGLNR